MLNSPRGDRDGEHKPTAVEEWAQHSLATLYITGNLQLELLSSPKASKYHPHLAQKDTRAQGRQPPCPGWHTAF